jgi:hypothetical protein
MFTSELPKRVKKEWTLTKQAYGKYFTSDFQIHRISGDPKQTNA